MTLPKANTPWPPEPYREAFESIREYQAWYSGEPESLARYYQSHSHPVRPSQRAGGVVGAVSRFWWGKPQPGIHTHRIHVPVASDVATTSASMIFSEPPRAILEDGYSEASGDPTASAAQLRLEHILNSPTTHSRLLEAAEQASALSGVYVRIVWDKDLMDHPFLYPSRPDTAIPEFKWGVLTAVTFWHELVNEGDRVVRHLERHEPGYIIHGLYEGTLTNLGRPVPFNEHEDTKWLEQTDNGVIETGTTLLTAAYWKNSGPSRNWEDPKLAPLGRSDYASILPIFDAIDETYASLMRDIRLGKARLLVPAHFLDQSGLGQGSGFNPDHEVFTPLQGVLGKASDQGQLVQANQFKIRVDEHLKTITELIAVALRGAGWSPASMGDDAVPLSTTATQVKSKERLSERTRDKKIQYTKAALAPLFQTLLHVDAHVYGTPMDLPDSPPELRFPEKVQQDIQEIASTASLLRSAEAASTVTLVRLAHPDWDDRSVNQEVAKIMEEKMEAGSPNPFSFRPGVE